MESKKTVVLGASPNPSRYSYLATQRLQNAGHNVVPIGLREGKIGELSIITELKPIENVNTVTLYVGPRNQSAYLDYILELNPQRVIMNPGTYNQELVELLEKNKIEAVEACTLVMLSANTY